jgi:hypothetical protein
MNFSGRVMWLNRRSVLLGATGAVVLTGLVFLAVTILWPHPAVTPAQAAIDVCAGSPVTMDAQRQSVSTWTGSADESEAAVRCRWPNVTVEALREQLTSLGYSDVEVSEGVTNYLGNSEAWVVSAPETPSRPAVAASSARGSKDLDVVIGGFIHVHDDDTLHIHDADGNEPGD